MKVIPYKDHLIVPFDNRAAVMIPHAQVFEHEGQKVMLVPHKVDETQVLRNLGYDVQPPIMLSYQWPGPPPFDAQRITAALITTNRRSYVFNGIGCVDADTEVLTPEGWVRISAWAGQPVAQYWPETGETDFVVNPEYVKLPCDIMLRLRTKYGVDQLLSPEHRVLLVDGDRQEVVSAEELFARHNQFLRSERGHKQVGRIGYKHAHVPTTFTPPLADGLPMTDAQLRVQVAFHADGSIRGDARVWGRVNLKKQRKKARLRQLLEAAGIAWTERHKTGTGAGYTEFAFIPPVRTKVFGPEWWQASPAQLAVVADEVLHWDGSVTHGDRWSSASAACADFVQYAFAATGRTARVVRRARHRRGRVEVEHCLTVRPDGRPLGLAGVTGTGPVVSMWHEASTDGFKYCFMVPSTFLLFRRNGCIFASGNTGKTRSVLFAYDFMRQTTPGLGSLIVTAPLSTLRQTWAREILTVFPHLTYEVLHHERKAKRLDALQRPADIYLINHDGVEVIFDELMAARHRFAMACLDELSIYKNANTDMFKYTSRFVGEIDRVTGLTATPLPLAASDAYGQLKMITPQALQGQSFTRFREEVMVKINQFKWTNKRNAIDEVFRRFQPSIRFTRDECYDLPPCQTVPVEASLSLEQRAAFVSLQKEYGIESMQVIAVNGADRINKLLQVSQGFVYDKNHAIIELPVGDRLKLLEDVIEQSNSKTIVFAPYKASIARLIRHLSPRWSVAEVSGDISPSKREQIFTQFMHSPDPHVLVAHPDCMSHGLTLTEASTIAWWGPPNSLETYEQANGRITRAGQRHSQFIANIMSTKLEQKVFALLDQRADVQQSLLDMFEEQGFSDLL